MTAYEPIPGSILATLTTAALVLAGLELLFSMMGDLRSCHNFKSISPDAGTSSPALRCGSTRERDATRHDRCGHFCHRQFGVMFGGGRGEELSNHSPRSRDPNRSRLL